MIKTGQARGGLNRRRFLTEIGGLEIFFKFRLSSARALSSDTSLELAASILNFGPFFGDIFFYLTTNVFLVLSVSLAPSFHNSRLTGSTLLILIPFIVSKYACFVI